MKFERKYNIGRLASVDVTRPHLTGAYLDVEKKRMFATNGHAIAVVPCTVDPSDRSGLLPTEVIDRARKSKKPEISARKRLARVGRDAMFRRPDAQPVPVDTVIPSFKYGDKGTVSISLKPAYLIAAAQCIGRSEQFHGDFVTLTFEPRPDELSPIVVSWEGEEAVAVVMPARRR